MHPTIYLLLALSASQTVLAVLSTPALQTSQRSTLSIRTDTLLDERQASCSCHRDAFLIGVCSQCTWSGRTICECPSAMVEQYCNNELIMCMGQATNVGEMCDVLMCSGAMDGGGGGGAGGSSPKPSGCAAGYKTCAGSWCIKSDEVCCGGDQLGSDSCPKGKVCVKSGTKMMCGNPGSTSGGASAAPAVQGGASGGTGTGPKTASGSRLTTIAGWVGTLGVAVGSVLL